MHRKPSSSSLFDLKSVQSEFPAQLSHCDWLQDDVFVSVLRASWQNQFADYIGSEAAKILVDQAHTAGDIYQHNTRGTLVATLSEQFVGIVSVRDLNKIFLITLLEVIPEHQGKGIANQLLNAIRTIKKPLLVHVSLHRPWLIKFYEKHGFLLLAPETVDHYGHSLVFNVMIRA